MILALTLLTAPAARAHIDLLEPEARAHGTAARNDPDIDVNSNLKSGPCGQVTSGRTDRVATYAAGQRITVRVREENAHVSYLRVSIDLDGEDFPLRMQFPGGPETQEAAQAAEDALGGDGLLAVVRENNDTPGFVHEIAVTLPSTSCTNCTLQVLQYMYDDPAAPYYFQCADLVITAAESADAGAAMGAGSAGTAGTLAPPGSGAAGAPAAANGVAGSANGSAASAVAQAAGGVAGSGGSESGATGSLAGGGAVASAGADDKTGCSLSRRGPGPASVALSVLALGWLQRRRRSRELAARGSAQRPSGAERRAPSQSRAQCASSS